VDTIPAIVSTFGLAFFWFIGAIPAGAALNLALPIAALTAWISYAAGVAVIVLIGAPLRERIIRRFNLSLEHDPNKLFWRAWDRFGLIGLGLLAPVTVGSQIGALIGLALGVSSLRLLIAMVVGAALWTLVIAGLVAVGVSIVQ